MSIQTESELKQVVWDVVHRTPVFDLHTHLYDARFGDLLLWGIDELLTYHYLVAEAFRLELPARDHFYEMMDYDTFYSLSKHEQADLIWNKVFLEHSPVGESARGVLTSLGLLELDPGKRDLAGYRHYFDDKSAEQHIDDVLRIGNLSGVVMTNDPFDDHERGVWEKHPEGDKRFRAALRLDGLLNDWRTAARRLRGWGYAITGKNINKHTVPEIQRFLHHWCDIMKPMYMAVSLPPEFDPFDGEERSKLIEKCVLPVCHERKLPFAMMIGVKKLVNPGLRVAGDSVGKGDVGAVERLCREYPQNKFLVTMLARENQHELCVAARKFSNLMPFGCWWFLNDPMTIDEMTRMRLELLGLSFIPQHSDARVLDQLLYKWAHSRWLLALVLQDKYADLHRTGWRVSEHEIERDVHNLLAGNFLRFTGE